MSAANFGPPGQYSQHPPAEEDHRQEPVLVLFNGAYILPSTTYERADWGSDAQIAARRAMAKRSSRSYAGRVSRARSKKKEMLPRPMMPTLDTSFVRLKGAAPRQVYPKEYDVGNNKSLKKHSWFGLGTPGTRGRGLGIMKGTPQPEQTQEQPNKDPKTADSLTSGTKNWLEISPSDRPIPIGISLPSDSVADISPYQSTRQRSESDATLVTPSIIITPAGAMKSVWSPDTESEYTPSVYSRATFITYPNDPNVPPVPALPADVLKSTVGKSSLDMDHNKDGATTRKRNDTLDSAGTTFEDMEYELSPKNRITSTATMFEEDEVPLRDRQGQLSALTPDTTTVPTPRRSRGWWNVITTPFEFSRSNSTWTQTGRNTEKIPDAPEMPQHFGGFTYSPSTSSTYIWSATEKSPSTSGDSPMVPMPLTIPHKGAPTVDMRQHEQIRHDIPEHTRQMDSSQEREMRGPVGAALEKTGPPHFVTSPPVRQTGDANVASPLSAMSASPVVGTATIRTVLMPRQVSEQQQQQQQPIHINIELLDRRPDMHVRTSSAPVAQPIFANPQAPQSSRVEFSTPSTTASRTPPQPSPPPIVQRYGLPSNPREIIIQRSQTGTNTPGNSTPQFPPPPHFSTKSPQAGFDYSSRASSPISFTDAKSRKKHRKAFNFMDLLPSVFRRRRDKKQGKKKHRSRKLCWGCCCCLLILVLLAIVVPVVVVTTKKNNNNTSSNGPVQTPTTQWLNLTGYPPIPTGISTIARPENAEEESGCIGPATAWSCAVPKEDQQAISPNKSDQPNFELQITYDNSSTSSPSRTRRDRRASNPVSAGAAVRSRFLNVRAAPAASPAPPSIADYTFLGNTTDDNQAPFEGEDTPFFISFLDPKGTTSSRLARRAAGGNITNAIPPPRLNSDGTAAPANLLPLTSNQPLRLFNRGKDDEHYGFFVYYDRSIFLKSILRNGTLGGNPADVDGGAALDAATLRCTWAQTRFLVQIWTKSQKTKPLLGSSSSANSSATSFQRPGSFPYPVTVTIDRHGGSATDKMAYCYTMDNDGKIQNLPQNKHFLFEDRTFGGTIVNPSKGPDVNVTGPIDGGHGGCSCQWQNWLA